MISKIGDNADKAERERLVLQKRLPSVDVLRQVFSSTLPLSGFMELLLAPTNPSGS